MPTDKQYNGLKGSSDPQTANKKRLRRTSGKIDAVDGEHALSATSDPKFKEDVAKRLKKLRKNKRVGVHDNDDGVIEKHQTEHHAKPQHNDQATVSNSAAPNQLTSNLAIPNLAILNIYFIVKAVFFYQGLIGFHPWENLAFAAVIVIPLKVRSLYLIRNILAFPLALLLLYYDSWLPSLGRLFELSSQIQGFSVGYIFEVIYRSIKLEVVAAIFLVIALYTYLQRWIRFSLLVGIGLVSMLIIDPDTEVQTLTPATAQSPKGIVNQTAQTSKHGNVLGNNIDNANFENTNDIDNYLTHFYAFEAQREVSFSRPSAATPPFDIIILNLCSLSWADLNYAGNRDHSLFDQFDLVFNNFNSAASYSGPASIRLLQSTCGQKPHSELFATPDPNCLLFNALQGAGFKKEWILNHDGEYDSYRQLLQRFGGLNQSPISPHSLPIAQRSFDGSPIYNDHTTLQYWLQQREGERKQQGRRHERQHEDHRDSVALFYNSISLHDGNRLTGALKNLDSTENFKQRIDQLLNDLEQFLKDLRSSGHRFIVVMIPEHGAAIEGDAMQLAGLREIPAPAITHVPVALSIVGSERTLLEPTVISQPVSYLDVTDLLSKLITARPFSEEFNLESLLGTLQTTAAVSENEEAIVIKHNGTHYLNIGRSEWMHYAP